MNGNAIWKGVNCANCCMYLLNSLFRSSAFNFSQFLFQLSASLSRLDNHNLRADGRRRQALKVVDRTGSGLQCVSPRTVADLITKKKQLQYIIIDCRYPYEYDGGHIEGAINVFTHSDLVKEIFDRVPAQHPSDATPRLFGRRLARRLAAPPKEPLPEFTDSLSDDAESGDEEEQPSEQTTCDGSDLELPSSSADRSLHETVAAPAEDGWRSDQDVSCVSGVSSNGSSGGSSGDASHTPFVILFHCEFSSQRAPEL